MVSLKIIHTADWHLGKNLEGRSRLKEQERFLSDFIQMVEEKEADLILIAGDIYDSPNPPAMAEKLFYNTLKKITDKGKRMVVIISGNHDSPERLMAAAPLAMEHGILIAGTPKTVIETGTYGKNKVLRSGEGYVEIDIRGERAVILLIPFPSEKRLDEVLYKIDQEEEERGKNYEERMDLLFRKLEKELSEDTIHLLVGHFFVMGSKEGGSERGVQLGGSYLIRGDLIPKSLQYAALGHIHKPQKIPGCKIARYSGSPLQYRRGEEGYEKQVMFVEVKAGEKCSMEEIPIKQYKPIEVWRCKGIEEGIKRCKKEQGRECWVYMEIQTDRMILDEEMKKMKEYKEDLLEIHPIFQMLEDDRVERRQEKPFLELFKEFYKEERGIQPSKEMIEMLEEIIGRENRDETSSIDNTRIE
jgi:exonuclease SbcD